VGTRSHCGCEYGFMLRQSFGTYGSGSYCIGMASLAKRRSEGLTVEKVKQIDDIGQTNYCKMTR